MVDVIVGAYNVSFAIFESLSMARVANMIAADLIDDVVMTVGTTYFPRPDQTSPRRAWSCHDDTNRGDFRDQLRNEFPSRRRHIVSPLYFVGSACVRITRE